MLTRVVSHLIRAVAAILAVAGTLALSPSAIAATRTDRVCQTQTTGVFHWHVYEVCLTGTTSYNGAAVNGYVSGLYCNIDYPTGIGYFCDHWGSGRRWGAYWNRAMGAWEEWLNQRVDYISPYAIYRRYFSNCVYLRIDVRSNGYTTYQNFANVSRSYLAPC